MTTNGTPSPGRLTLIGSGELAPSMSRVHRAIAARIDGPVRATFVDTPAGFESNAAAIAEKGAAYVQKHLGVACEIVTFRSSEHTDEADVRAALRTLRRSNYIFGGPGSPTYAVRNWRDTPVFAQMAARLEEGADVVLASAAAIAIGAQALPVYEIYKAGAEPHWIEGLDLLGARNIKVAIVPHWNNTEGSGYDTRHCFMGQERFERLEALLPAQTTVLGIDEYTACCIDLARGECNVLGAGRAVVRRDGHEDAFSAGESFSLDALAGGSTRRATIASAAGSREVDRRAALEHAIDATRHVRGDGDDVPGRVIGLVSALEDAVVAGVDQELTREARVALRELVDAWSDDDAAQANRGGDVTPFVELLIKVRASLRRDGHWALSDEIRDRLLGIGIALEDGASGTTWKMR